VHFLVILFCRAMDLSSVILEKIPALPIGFIIEKSAAANTKSHSIFKPHYWVCKFMMNDDTDLGGAVVKAVSKPFLMGAHLHGCIVTMLPNFMISYDMARKNDTVKWFL